MKKKKSPQSKSKCSPSALRVLKGVEGGHDGMKETPGKNHSHPSVSGLSLSKYVDGVRGGDRAILGRAITLIESNARQDQELAQKLLAQLMPFAGQSIRIGITGLPGAGKSTFIETLGTYLTDRGHKVAVTAVDPSSRISGGSILGDKTRMERLSRDPQAFIRPSPGGETLGGVARKTRETILVFEAAGYDVILVETIGVGQNETTVRSMVDFFLLLLIAGAGDELQGLKRGVMELADALVINKADGDNIERAEKTRRDFEWALGYLQPATEGWTTPALACSALTGSGVEAIWSMIEKHCETTSQSGVFTGRRREQAREWMHGMLEERVREKFYEHPEIAKNLPDIEKKVLDGSLPVTQAVWTLLQLFEKASLSHE